MVPGLLVKSTTMPKITYSARRNNNSKEPRKQLLIQNTRNRAPESSFEIRQVRQAQVIDADYMDKDIKFDTNKIIEYDGKDITELDELCGHNEKTLKEMELSIVMILMLIPG